MRLPVSIVLGTLLLPTLLLAGAAAAQPAQPPAQGTAPKMDMNAFMARCAQLRQQSGTAQTPQGRQALDRCDQMDRSMGMTPPARR